MRLALPTTCAAPTGQGRIINVDCSRLQMSEINCRRLTSDHDNDCDHIIHLVDFLRNISNKAVTRINHTLTEVNDLIRQFGDDDQTNKPRHSRRGLLNFVGEISHSLFGTARDSDISKMHAAMRHYETNQASLTAAWRQMGTRLASLSKSANSRLDHMMNMIDLQKQTVTELYAQVREETSALDHASSLIAMSQAAYNCYLLPNGVTEQSRRHSSSITSPLACIADNTKQNFFYIHEMAI